MHWQRNPQREIIRNDPAWKQERYLPGVSPNDGMRMARKLGLISYRSTDEWRQRSGHKCVAADVLLTEAAPCQVSQCAAAS